MKIKHKNEGFRVASLEGTKFSRLNNGYQEYANTEGQKFGQADIIKTATCKVRLIKDKVTEF